MYMVKFKIAMVSGDGKSKPKRRKVLRTTGAAIGGGILLGATGTTSAQGRGQNRGSDDDCNCSGPNISKQRVETDDNTIVTLIEVSGKKFLFREAKAYRDSEGASTQSTYEATKSGYPLEFGEVNSTITPRDISSNGEIGVQGVDFTPENFIEDYDVDVKTIGDCGDILFNNHKALEIHIQGGGAFSSIGVAGLAGAICYLATASALIPTGGWSGFAGATACSALTTMVDQAIDIEMVPNKAAVTIAYWDEDEEYPFGINTSPTIKVGIAGGYYKEWDEMAGSNEYDANVHLPL